MNSAAFQHPSQRFLVHAQIVTGGGLDILVTSQFLDEHDVSSTVQKGRAERMTQEVRRQLLGDACPNAKPPEQLGHVIAR